MRIGQPVIIAQGRFGGLWSDELEGIDVFPATVVSFDSDSVVVSRRAWPFGQRIETYSRMFVFANGGEVADKLFGKPGRPIPPQGGSGTARPRPTTQPVRSA